MDKQPLILVVDDSWECRTLLMWTLERHGFRTILAACGLEAVQLAIMFQPSLVLMDICMPGMDGYRATEAIHAHPRGRNIPVAAVSADCGDEGYVSRAFKGVFIACLGKPWEEEAILQMVTKVLARDVKPHATGPGVEHSYVEIARTTKQTKAAKRI